MDETPPSHRDEPSPSEPPESFVRPAVEFLTLGLSAAVTVLGIAAVGYLVDRWAGTSPVFTLIGLVLGVAAAVALVVGRVRKYLR